MAFFSTGYSWNPATPCLLLGALVVFQGCGPEGALKDAEVNGKPANQVAVKPVLVELAKVNRGRIEEILERSAALQAEQHVQVLARTQNPAVELLVEEGDQVGKGQVLLRLESDSQQTDYDQTLSQHEKARLEFERTEKLYKQNLVSESDFVNSRFTWDQARLQSEEAKRQLDYTEVKAPIKGTITRRMVKMGDKVTTGSPVFEIIDLQSTVAVIHVPEQYLPKLKKSMRARLTSDTLNGKVFEGFVNRISPIVDAEAGTIKVVVGVEELGALSPGMWVNVELILDEKPDAILIPKRAITYAVDQTFAFKVLSDTNGIMRAHRHLVINRNADKEHIEPTEGFQEGDLIVVAGQAGLKDASPISELDPEGSTVDILLQAKESVPMSKP
ncbi:MAG: efflux RND transporter periplasmic adaptor subunit [Verrucomicrobiota bacterium]|nr:efflux RND transporter periplasmic adaptor subunit [Verrucomicrobiota bacterium]